MVRTHSDSEDAQHHVNDDTIGFSILNGFGHDFGASGSHHMWPSCTQDMTASPLSSGFDSSVNVATGPINSDVRSQFVQPSVVIHHDMGMDTYRHQSSTMPRAHVVNGISMGMSNMVTLRSYGTMITDSAQSDVTSESGTDTVPWNADGLLRQDGHTLKDSQLTNGLVNGDEIVPWAGSDSIAIDSTAIDAFFNDALPKIDDNCESSLGSSIDDMLMPDILDTVDQDPPNDIALLLLDGFLRAF